MPSYNMISPRATGFYYTPVTKCLIGYSLLGTLAFSIPFREYQYWFQYSHETVFEKQDILRVVACRCVFLDLKDLLCAVLMLYHFRLFERRYGSRKFISHLIGICTLSMAVEIFALWALNRLELQPKLLPTGPYGMLFALFIPYFCDIPRVAMTHILHIPVTGKSLTYLLGLQMASGSVESLLLAACGILSGVLYRQNILWIKQVIRVPSWLGQLCQRTIGWLLDTPAPRGLNTPIGATLELQRQEQMDRLEQQLAWVQNQQVRQPNQGLGGFLRNFDFGLGGRGFQMPAPQVSEQQVQQLVDMGFTRDRVINALSTTNNDLTMATNILLQNS